MNNCAIVTVIAKNYLSFARVLTETVRTFHPEMQVFVVLADRVDSYFNPKKEAFKLITLDELNIPSVNKFCFAYRSRELIGALKPFALEHIFNKNFFDKVIYFDSDILILGSLKYIIELLDKHDIIITPHFSKAIITFKEEPQISWEELCVQGGVFNGGFIGVSKTPEGLNFVEWLKSRVTPFKDKRRFSIEQVWLNCVPAIFKNAHILRRSAYNLAFWNLHERKVQVKDGNLWVDDEPLCFYHFAGIDIENIDIITNHRYHNKILNNYLSTILCKHCQLKPIFEEYKRLNIKHGYRQAIKWPRAFDTFDSGEQISRYTRYLFMRVNMLWNSKSNPFSSIRLRIINIFTSLGGVFFEMLPSSIKKSIRTMLDSIKIS